MFSCQDDFVEKLTLEKVEEFDSIKRAWYEALRLESPIDMGSPAIMTEPVNIGGLQFENDLRLSMSINFMAIHTNPKEWRDPFTFNPDRFNPASKMYKRPDGGSRNPLAFTPFLGGKRVCLGKTFAEMTTKFTLPILLHYFNFKLMDKERTPLHMTSLA